MQHRNLEGHHLEEYLQTAGLALSSVIATEALGTSGASTSAPTTTPALDLTDSTMPTSNGASSTWQTLPDLHQFSLADLLQPQLGSSTHSTPGTYTTPEGVTAPMSMWPTNNNMTTAAGLAAGGVIPTKLEPIETTLQLQAHVPQGLHLGMLSLASHSLPPPVRGGPAAAAAALGAPPSLKPGHTHMAAAAGPLSNAAAPGTHILGALSSHGAEDFARTTASNLLHRQVLARTGSDASVQSHGVGVLLNGALSAGPGARSSGSQLASFSLSLPNSRPGSGDMSQGGVHLLPSPALHPSPHNSGSQGSHPLSQHAHGRVLRSTSSISHRAHSSLRNLSINGNGSAAQSAAQQQLQQQEPATTLASVMFRSGRQQLGAGQVLAGGQNVGGHVGTMPGGAVQQQQQLDRFEMHQAAHYGGQGIGMACWGAAAGQQLASAELRPRSQPQLQLRAFDDEMEQQQLQFDEMDPEAMPHDKAAKRGRHASRKAVVPPPRARGPRRRLRHQILDVEAVIAAQQEQVAALEAEQASLRLRARVLEHAVACRAEQVAYLRAAAATSNNSNVRAATGAGTHDQVVPATGQQAASDTHRGVSTRTLAQDDTSGHIMGSNGTTLNTQQPAQPPVADHQIHIRHESAPPMMTHAAPPGCVLDLAAPAERGSAGAITHGPQPMEVQIQGLAGNGGKGGGPTLPLSCPTSWTAAATPATAAAPGSPSGRRPTVRPSSDTSTSGPAGLMPAAVDRRVGSSMLSAAAVAEAQGLPLIQPNLGLLAGAINGALKRRALGSGAAAEAANGGFSEPALQRSRSDAATRDFLAAAAAGGGLLGVGVGGEVQRSSSLGPAVGAANGAEGVGKGVEGGAEGVKMEEEGGEEFQQEQVQAVEHGYGTRRARRATRGSVGAIAAGAGGEHAGGGALGAAAAVTTTSVGATTTSVTTTTTTTTAAATATMALGAEDGAVGATGQVQGHPLSNSGRQANGPAPSPPPPVTTRATRAERDARVTWLESEVYRLLAGAGGTAGGVGSTAGAGRPGLGLGLGPSTVPPPVHALFGGLAQLSQASLSDVLHLYRRAAASFGSTAVQGGSDERWGEHAMERQQGTGTLPVLPLHLGSSKLAAAPPTGSGSAAAGGGSNHLTRSMSGTGSSTRVTWGELLGVLPLLHAANPGSILALGAPLTDDMQYAAHATQQQHWSKVARALQLADSQLEELAMLGELVGRAWGGHAPGFSRLAQGLAELQSHGGTQPGRCLGGAARQQVNSHAAALQEGAQRLATSQWSCLALAADVVLTRVLTTHQVAQLLGLSYPWAPHPLAIMQAAWEEVRCRQQGGQHPGA